MDRDPLCPRCPRRLQGCKGEETPASAGGTVCVGQQDLQSQHPQWPHQEPAMHAKKSGVVRTLSLGAQDLGAVAFGGGVWKERW